MLKLAVIGKDVSKSQSPQMHAFLLGKMGERCRYDKLSLAPGELSRRAEELLSAYDGLNVTIPYKTEIIPYLKTVEGDAKTFGAVNTVLCARRAGYNTDGYGFLLMLENAGVCVRAKRVLVLGAGGAGRSCIKKLTEAGAEVFVYERDAARLGQVYGEFGGFVPLGRVEDGEYDVIFNCTGVGMHDTVGRLPSVRGGDGAEAPLPNAVFARCGAAVDLIYEPAESAFLETARRFGARTLNGASMLFYQAYRADCHFLGRAPSAEEARELYNEYTAAADAAKKEER